MRRHFSRRLFLGYSGAVAGALALPALARANQASTPDAATPSAGMSDQPMIRVEVTGGFAPIQLLNSALPTFVMYPDGRVITQGPVPAIFPAPALPNLRESDLTQEGIRTVLTAAEEAGLIGQDRHIHHGQIVDAPTTYITVTVDSRTTRTSVYAMTIDDDPNWTDEEREAVAKIRDFYNKTLDIFGWLPETAFERRDETFQIEQLQIIAEPYPETEATPDDPATNQPPMDWPLSTPLSALTGVTLQGLPDTTRCFVFSGEEARTLVTALQQANELTPWVSEGNRYRLMVRPLLPGESGCPPPSPLWDPEMATPTA